MNTLKKFRYAIALLVVSVLVLALYFYVPDPQVVGWVVLPPVLFIGVIALLAFRREGREEQPTGSRSQEQRDNNAWGIFSFVFGLAAAAFATVVLAMIVTVVTGFPLEITTLKSLASTDGAAEGVIQVLSHPRDISSLRILWGVVVVAGSVSFGVLMFLGGKRGLQATAGLMVVAVIIVLPFMVSLELQAMAIAQYQHTMSIAYGHIVETRNQTMQNTSDADEDLARGKSLKIRRIVYDTVGYDPDGGWQEVHELTAGEEVKVDFSDQRDYHLAGETCVLVFTMKKPETKEPDEGFKESKDGSKKLDKGFYVPVSAVEGRKKEEPKQPVKSRLAKSPNNAITEAPKYEPAEWYSPSDEALDEESRQAIAQGKLIVQATDLQPGQMSEAYRFSTRELGVTGYRMERSKGLPLFVTVNGAMTSLPSGEDPELPTIYNVGDFKVKVPDSAEFGGNVKLLLHTN